MNNQSLCAVYNNLPSLRTLHVYNCLQGQVAIASPAYDRLANSVLAVLAWANQNARGPANQNHWTASCCTVLHNYLSPPAFGPFVISKSLWLKIPDQIRFHTLVGKIISFAVCLTIHGWLYIF